MTFETYQKNREEYIQLLNKAKEELKKYDLSYFMAFVNNLFEKYPLVKKISWAQGFMYNDERDIFAMTRFKINDLSVSYSVVSHRREYFQIEMEDAGLLDSLEKEMLQQMDDCAMEFSDFARKLREVCSYRYFADTFGNVKEIILEPGQLTIKDYDNDSNTTWLIDEDYFFDS
ncbi:MAG: hypothetical protein NZ551_09555 [Microscillaceae bacterium]|nr:hypothetical protein [Microscillaceae bacterium]MDW8348196.1 hypothetical protein [Bacteroidia bacterium]MDW8461446.1 hypothetical protein [Cytophagales bacterium]